MLFHTHQTGKNLKVQHHQTLEKRWRILVKSLWGAMILFMMIGNTHIPTSQEIYSQGFTLQKHYLVGLESVNVCGSITFNHENLNQPETFKYH